MGKIVILALIVIVVTIFVYNFVFIKINEVLKRSLKDNVNLTAALSVKEEQISKLSIDLKNKQDELGRVGKDLTEFQKVKDALFAAQDTINAMNKEEADLRKKKIDLEEKNNYLKAQIQSNNEDIVRLQGELGEVERKLGDLNQKGKIISSRTRTSDKDILELRESLALKEKNLSSLKKEFNEFKKNYNEILAERDKLYKDIEELQNYHSFTKQSQVVWERKIQEVKTKLQISEGEKNKLEEELREAAKAKEKMASELKAMKKKEEKLNALNTNLLNKLTHFPQQVSSKEKRISKLERELKIAKAAFNKEVASLKAKITTQRNKLDKVTAMYSGLKEQLKEAAAILSRWEDRFSDKNREITSLKNEISYLKLELSETDKKEIFSKSSGEESAAANFPESKKEKQTSQNLTINKQEEKETLQLPSAEDDIDKSKAEKLRKEVEVILQLSK